MSRYSIDLPVSTAAEKAADNIIARLQANGFTAYRVGGAVRDRLLGLSAYDVDVATDAPPAAVRGLFHDTYGVGESFAVIIVHTPEKVDVEVATFREEKGYADGRHPAEVSFSDAATDAQRRDFTINALFYDPAAREVLDFTDGLTDLRRGVIRTVGRAEQRFGEDYLRMPRAIRFAAAFRFTLEPETGAAIRGLAEKVNNISRERIFQELTRMLTGPAPAYAFSLLRQFELLPHLLPEAAKMKGIDQPPQFHPEGDVWEHTLLMLEKMVTADPLLAWSTLLHDIGKPLTHEYREGRDRFPNHASKGADSARCILRRLKASRQLIEETGEVVNNHMNFMNVTKMRPVTLRRLLARPTFSVELELHRLDCLASHAKLDGYCFLLDKLAELANQPRLPPPLVNGHDLLAMGLQPGPRIGELLKWVQDLQLNGEIAGREQALAVLREHLASDSRAGGVNNG